MQRESDRDMTRGIIRTCRILLLLLAAILMFASCTDKKQFYRSVYESIKINKRRTDREAADNQDKVPDFDAYEKEREKLIEQSLNPPDETPLPPLEIPPPSPKEPAELPSPETHKNPIKNQ